MIILLLFYFTYVPHQSSGLLQVEPVLHASIIIDQGQLHCNILHALLTDPLYISHAMDLKPHWSTTPDGFLYHKSLMSGDTPCIQL